MTLIESSPIIAACLGDASAERRAGHVVVWFRGEHDVSTAAALWETVAGAMAFADTDLVVDLSGVAFMDASTIGVIVEASAHLGARSRSLTVRSPAPCARRILDICGLTDLIDTGADDRASTPPPTTALGSWVVVPATDRGDRAGGPGLVEPHRAPGHSGNGRATGWPVRPCP